MKILSTTRLRIEPLRSEHAPIVFEALQAPEIYTYIPDEAPEIAALQTRYDFLENGKSPNGDEHWLNWVVFLSDSKTPIGTFQATLPKVGQGSFAYIVFPPFWRQGFAAEMTRCVLTHVFNTYHTPTMIAEIDTRNEASIRLVESLGMKRIAMTKEADLFKGESSDEYTYSISRESWVL